MKLFVWRNTDCNQLYSRGDIVAMAPDLEAAKRAVLAEALTAMIGYDDMRSKADGAQGTGEYADDCRAEIAAVLDRVRADLEKPPAVYDTDAAAFFNGGE